MKVVVKSRAVLTVDVSDLMDSKEVADVLGLKRPMVYVLVAEGKLRPLMVQRRKVFAREDVLALKKAREGQ